VVIRITENGIICNDTTGYIMKQSIDSYGYMVVNLGHGKTYKVHRLLAITYLPNPDELETVNHKDGIKIHNYVSNIEWMSAKDNLKHARDTGLSAGGIRSGRSKLTEQQVKDVWLQRGKIIAKEVIRVLNLPCSINAVYDIWESRSWTHLTSKLHKQLRSN